MDLNIELDETDREKLRQSFLQSLKKFYPHVIYMTSFDPLIETLIKDVEEMLK